MLPGASVRVRVRWPSATGGDQREPAAAPPPGWSGRCRGSPGDDRVCLPVPGPGSPGGSTTRSRRTGSASSLRILGRANRARAAARAAARRWTPPRARPAADLARHGGPAPAAPGGAMRAAQVPLRRARTRSWPAPAAPGRRPRPAPPTPAPGGRHSALRPRPPSPVPRPPPEPTAAPSCATRPGPRAAAHADQPSAISSTARRRTSPGDPHTTRHIHHSSEPVTVQPPLTPPRWATRSVRIRVPSRQTNGSSDARSR